MATNGSSPRVNLTLTAEEAGRLEEYARSIDRRPTTAARDLLLAGLAAAGGNGGQPLADLQRRYEEVQRERDDLLRKLDAAFEAQRPPPDAAMPVASPSETTGGEERRARRRRRWARWKWPTDDLLADTAWWDRWLPDLYELLGRDLRGEPDRLGSPGEPVVDQRGYGDLLTYLFPPVGDVTWRSADYPRVASEQPRQGAQHGASPSVRAQVWEPVVRHVATALRALEETSAAGSDPQVRLEAQARITGSWVLILGNLLGQHQTARLPDPIR
jgi:hypothetical protein